MKTITLLLGLIISRAVIASTVSLDSGPIQIDVDSGGTYRIQAQSQGWVFKGSLGAGFHISKTGDSDQLGAYEEISLTGDLDKPSYSIRLYRERPVVLFGETIRRVAANQARFPVFQKFPSGLKSLSYRRQDFSPAVFDLSGDAPWVFFDSNANAMILSPANHFMISNNFKGTDGSLSVGIENQVSEVPGSLKSEAILVIASGINSAYEIWGNALTDLQGKKRPGNDSDKVLSSLGYWTDNRSAYWYNFVKNLGYEGTLRAVVREFQEKGILLGHLQLDSWWYPKGGDAKAKPPIPPSWEQRNYGRGIYLYEGAKELFPNGVVAFQKSIGLPLVTHSRWIDPSSPYVGHYSMSKQVSTDPKYWDRVMSYLHDNGITTYEQDWLNDKALPRLDLIADGDRFLDEMAQGAAKYGISLQYCMPLPRHFLQGSKYSNLRSIRPSGDGFERGKWTQFLLGSRFATALGIWPWADVFFSQDRENLLIANLSAGIVGVGDRLSTASDPSGDYRPDWCKKDVDCRVVNVDNLRQVVRGDGVVVKPDTGLVPTDSSYLDTRAMLATASSGSSAVYLFAYSRVPEASGVSSDAKVEIDPRKLGMTGPVYLYRYFEKKGEVIREGQTKTVTVPRQGTYFVLVPVEANGVAVLGDPGLFVTMGRQRVVPIAQDEESKTLRLSFSNGETDLTLQGYSSGGVPQTTIGVIDYDSATRVFRVRITKPASLNGKPWAALVTLAMPPS